MDRKITLCLPLRRLSYPASPPPFPGIASPRGAAMMLDVRFARWRGEGRGALLESRNCTDPCSVSFYTKPRARARIHEARDKHMRPKKIRRVVTILCAVKFPPPLWRLPFALYRASLFTTCSANVPETIWLEPMAGFAIRITQTLDDSGRNGKKEEEGSCRDSGTIRFTERRRRNPVQRTLQLK